MIMIHVPGFRAFCMVSIACALLMWSCAGSAYSSYGDDDERSPGLYELSGWNGESTYWNGETNVAAGTDINGEVGHPLSVYYPTASCLPSREWTAGGVKFVSGTLPPGLQFGEHWGISGIPTERGHWIVKLRMYDIKCEGGSYSMEQELRFHITGTGKVIR
jgi:hypothetical protein